MKVYGHLALEGELQNVVIKELEKPRMWYKITEHKNIEKLPAQFNMTAELVRRESLTPRSTIDVEILMAGMPAETPVEVAQLIRNPEGEWVYENADFSIIYIQAY